MTGNSLKMGFESENLDMAFGDHDVNGVSKGHGLGVCLGSTQSVHATARDGHDVSFAMDMDLEMELSQVTQPHGAFDTPTQIYQDHYHLSQDLDERGIPLSPLLQLAHHTENSTWTGASPSLGMHLVSGDVTKTISPTVAAESTYESQLTETLAEVSNNHNRDLEEELRTGLAEAILDVTSTLGHGESHVVLESDTKEEAFDMPVAPPSSPVEADGAQLGLEVNVEDGGITPGKEEPSEEAVSLETEQSPEKEVSLEKEVSPDREGPLVVERGENAMIAASNHTLHTILGVNSEEENVDGPSSEPLLSKKRKRSDSHDDLLRETGVGPRIRVD
jgi:hypothetical protein